MEVRHGQRDFGGNFVVGVVIFLILLVIQFLVVNHGAVRTSEVTARFTLDAMPGKQMAVDADLAAGMIDETEAKRRREDISQAAEFHGAPPVGDSVQYPGQIAADH